MQDARREKIYVYLDANNKDSHALKIFGLVLKYPKNVCEPGVVIASHPIFVGRDVDYRQEYYKIVQIVLQIQA